QRSVSGFFFLIFAANSTSRLIASARDGRSVWRRRQSSTVRKNCSDTRIWNGRSWVRPGGRPRGRWLLAIFCIDNQYLIGDIYCAGRWQAANSPPALTQATEVPHGPG